MNPTAGWQYPMISIQTDVINLFIAIIVTVIDIYIDTDNLMLCIIFSYSPTRV